MIGSRDLALFACGLNPELKSALAPRRGQCTDVVHVLPHSGPCRREGLDRDRARERRGADAFQKIAPAWTRTFLLLLRINQVNHVSPGAPAYRFSLRRTARDSKRFRSRVEDDKIRRRLDVAGCRALPGARKCGRVRLVPEEAAQSPTHRMHPPRGRKGPPPAGLAPIPPSHG